jgi:hypothetical protein
LSFLGKDVAEESLNKGMKGSGARLRERVNDRLWEIDLNNFLN